MIGAVLLALTAIPLLGLITSTGLEAGFTEGHLLVHARAQAILDAQESLGWEALATPLTTAHTGSPLALSIPPEAGPPVALPGAPGGSLYAERLTARALDSDLASLAVEIAWTFALDRRVSPRSHVVRTVRILARPDGSWAHRIPLPTAGGSVAD